MAVTELRMYKIRAGVLAEFTERFQDQIAPARRAHGFEVLGPWTTADDEFVWMARYDGQRSWNDAVAAYYDSPERRQIDFDPMDYIESIETKLLTSILEG